MRILQVRFKNLNSLWGEWAIDFTHPAYTSDGIFAITGPTGAGKTTILDAVCLALYGRTPRLNKVTKGANEIMSRQTGECFAEVVFETQAGRFRCHWSQRRARRKPDGDLQPPKHEIADMSTGKVFETKLRDVAEHIDTVTGMDFDRFTRSMLLAQGGFAAFLQAGPDERAPILEQITGTEVYSQISIKVHERWAEERGKLEEMRLELESMRFLSQEEEQRLQAGLEEKLKQEDVASGEVKRLGKAVAWLDGIITLEKDLAAVEEQWREFQMKQETFQPELKRLDEACRALPLSGDYAGICALRRLQRSEMLELGEAREKLPACEAALKDARNEVKAAAGSLEEQRGGQRREADLIRKVRELDLRISEKRKQVESAAGFLKQVEKEIMDNRRKALEAEKLLVNSRAAFSEIDEYLCKHSADAGLTENLTAIYKTFDSLRETWKKRKKSQDALLEADTKKKAAVQAVARLEAAAAALRSRVADAQREQIKLAEEIGRKLGGRELREWRLDLETLKERKRLLDQTSVMLENISALRLKQEELQLRQTSLVREREKLAGEVLAETRKQSACELEIGHLELQVNLLNRIRSLEEERGRLEDGKPCPLCGSTDHPYARGNIPELSEAEASLKRAGKEFKKISNNLTALKARQAGLEKEIEQGGRRRDEVDELLQGDRNRCHEILAALRIDAGEGELATRVNGERDITQKGIELGTRVIEEVELLEKKRSSAVEALEKACSASVQSDKDLHAAIHGKDIVEREFERIGRECEDLAEQFVEARKGAARDLEPYGIGDVAVAGLEGLQKDLAARRDRWQQMQVRKTGLEKQILALEAELEKQQLFIEKIDEDLRVKRESDRELRNQLGCLVEERLGLYDTKSPDEEEKRFADAVANAENLLERTRSALNSAEQDLNRLKAKTASLEASISKRTEEMRQAEEAFSGRITQAGFADEAAYQKACLPEEERTALSFKAEKMRKEQTEIETRRQDKTRLLSEERRKMATDKSRETLQRELETCVGNLRETQQEIGAVRQRLTENLDLRARQQERIQAMESQKSEYARWHSLHELIGSADGKKYRNFAQGLTFEIMVAHANYQLRGMTDRYLLVRDGAQPLELNVIDSYQAGEIRSTKNLSGGESFIVSLSLALGLSQISSRNVRVDSLFLDEGFGTLDEDALETALETLAGLRQDGKIIGVISHVSALRERIGTQIQVTPRTGGRSVISGPGCLCAG